jgi:integrase/recombinase XerD
MTDQAMSPLRRRMIEDMTIRKFAPKTQHDYLQRVKNFTIHLGRSPDTASSGLALSNRCINRGVRLR